MKLRKGWWKAKFTFLGKRLANLKDDVIFNCKFKTLIKKLDKEKEKLINLLWSGPKKNSRASKIMRIAVLDEVGVWDTENAIAKHEEYYSKIDINCIDDLKKITWQDWRKRRIMRHKPGSYNRNIDRTKKYGNCRPGKESWKMLQDCIKRARYYK